MGDFTFVDVIAREAMLFAGIGLLIGGLDDFAIDLIYLVRRVWTRHRPRTWLTTLSRPTQPGRIVIFVPAWDEVAVIGHMLTNALARFDHPDYRIYVGVYPNDQPTIDAATAVANGDHRIRVVIGDKLGPTTKADCLNTLWRELLSDERAEGVFTKAVVLHDAEDVVHAAELRIFDTLIEGRAVVQMPVLPLIKRGSRLVSGHYADEFAEAHTKQLIVRAALGAGLPLAGTGCAIAPFMLAKVAALRGGDPFDATSLTEDYELGLRIADLGGDGLFARVHQDDGQVVAVRAHFPGDLISAIRQKARWMTGIAFAGWDRTGWARPFALSDHWMRMRDRRAPLAMLVLATAYVALLLWGIVTLIHLIRGTTAPPANPLLDDFIFWNALLLCWRLAMRMAFTRRVYGWQEALWSVPRFVVGNFVALAAAPRALLRYAGILRGHTPVWDKTQHEFPDAA